jgi:hypothetical protein
MLSLAISGFNCYPGSKAAKHPTAPAGCKCAICSSTGGVEGELLELHKISQAKQISICPFCHMCLHLDFAGRVNAGRIIWLHEISQEELNVLALASYVLMRKAEIFKKNPETAAILENATRLMKSFEKRAAVVESFLSGPNQTDIVKRSLSTPARISALMQRAKSQTKMDNATMAKKIDGLRLLPDPKVFERHIALASRYVSIAYPPAKWANMVSEQLEAGKLSDESDLDSTEHFDAAEPMVAE